MSAWPEPVERVSEVLRGSAVDIEKHRINLLIWLNKLV